MRIVFMGTPDFAVPSLDILFRSGYDIPAVVTAPDKPGGRLGMQVSAVKRYAVEKGLPVLQPPKLRAPEFVDALRVLEADLQVVVAFRMLPEAVWAMPPLGTINLHGSLLPRYRGAAPINWAVINGETETGLTTFLLRHEIDTGDILLRQPVPIGPEETAGELYERMMHIGAQLVLRTVQMLEQGNYKPLPQTDEEATHAPKIFAETCQLDFSKSPGQAHNFIRGLSPHPGAWMRWQGKVLKLWRSALPTLDSPPNLTPGALQVFEKKRLLLGLEDGCIEILELQPEGKKRMKAEAFINGWH